MFSLSSWMVPVLVATTVLLMTMEVEVTAQDDIRVMLPEPRFLRGARSMRYRGVQGLADKGW